MDILNKITGSTTTDNTTSNDEKFNKVINTLQSLTEEVKTIKDSLSSNNVNADSSATPSSMETMASPSMEPMASPSMEPMASPSMEPMASPSMEPMASPSMEPVASGTNSISSQSIMNQPISISGYNGTVGEIVSKINKKIGQLTSPSSKGRYIDKANELKSIVNSIRKATTVDEVKSIISNKITFKNNNLMGGKTRKHRKGRKKGTKRH
jgi:hypothetical protein